MSQHGPSVQLGQVSPVTGKVEIWRIPYNNFDIIFDPRFFARFQNCRCHRASPRGLISNHTLSACSR